VDNEVEAQDCRRLLLNLTSADWKVVHPHERSIRNQWADSLSLHAKAIDFGNGPSRIFLTKLNGLNSWGCRQMVKDLRGLLKKIEAAGGNSSEWPPALRAIAELKGSDWESPESQGATTQRKTRPAKVGEAPRTHLHATDLTTPPLSPLAAQDTPSETTNTTAATSAVPPEMQLEVIDRLDQLRGPLASGLRHLSESVSAGRRVDLAPSDGFKAWGDLWEKLPSEANQLDAARELATSMITASLQEEDQQLAQTVLGLRFSNPHPADVAAIEPVLQHARSASLPLTDDDRQVLNAFIRVIGGIQASPLDASLVQTLIRE